MAINKQRNILVAPLDWGLGHTTRCLPMIQFLQEMGHHVVFAGNQWQCSFVKKSIADLAYVHLEGYNVSYSALNRWAQMGIVSQLPSIHRSIKRENRLLKQICKEHNIHGIVSDNRYGSFHDDIPSVIVTHQPGLITGLGAIPDRIIQKVHYQYLNRFEAVWIPDISGEINLGGCLSHPDRMPDRAEYIGLLSRFERRDVAVNLDRILILLSGPEPQRSILAASLWKQVARYDGQVTFVAGNEHALPPKDIPQHIRYHALLTGDELLYELNECATVVCRSGYSTLMDLVALGKKSIIVPTPGQTEQEYLGLSLHEKGIFLSVKQKNLNLNNVMQSAKDFPFYQLDVQPAYTLYKKVIQNWVSKL